MKKVNEVARESKVSVRALHHYDEIGLIKPLREKGIRLYSDEDIEKLRQVLLFKELGFTLLEIKEILEKKVSMRIIKEKRDGLIEKRNRINQVIAMIDSFSIMGHSDITTNQLKNPLGPYIRRLVGDETLNTIFDSENFDTTKYTQQISSIFQQMKLNIHNSEKLNALIGQQYIYMVESINVKMSKKEFVDLILNHVDEVKEFDTEEREIYKARLIEYS